MVKEFLQHAAMVNKSLPVKFVRYRHVFNFFHF